MKRLNITKEQFEKSRYFKNKYGTLEYVSESGKLFNDTAIYGLDSGYVKETGWRARIYKDNGMYEYTIEQWDDRRKEWMKTSFGTPSRSIEQMLEDLATETDGTDIPICCELPLARKVASVMKNFQLNESRKLFKTSKGKVLMFNEVRDPDSDKWWLGIKYAVEQPNDIYYRGMKLDKDDLFALVNELYEETYDMDDAEFQMWMREHTKEMKYVLREAMVDEWDPEYKEYSVPVWNDTYDGYTKALHLKPYRTQNESSPRFRCMEDAGVTTSTGGRYATFLTDMVAGFLEKQRGIDNVEHGDDGILVMFSDGGQVVVSFDTVQH